MTAETKQIFIEVAEKHGIFQIWEKQRIDEVRKQSAKKMLLDGLPAENISKWMELPLEVVEAL